MTCGGEILKKPGALQMKNSAVQGIALDETIKNHSNYSPTTFTCL